MSKMIVLSFLIIAFLMSANTQENTEENLSHFYRKYCEKRLTDKDRESFPSLPKRLLVETNATDLEVLQRKFSDASDQLSETDRIVLANLLFSSRSTDFELINKILSFNSNDKIIEAYRNYYQGNLEFLKGSTSDGFKKMSLSINALPFIDSVLILNFFGASLDSEKVKKSDLNESLTLLSKVPDVDPFKPSILAFKKYLESPEYDAKAMGELTRLAYKECQIDQSTALGYAITLYIDEKKPADSLKVLEKITKESSFYSPLVDVYLARVYYELKDMPNSKKHQDLAKVSSVYLGPKDQQILMDLEKSATSVESTTASYVKIVAIISIFLLFGFGLIVGFKRRKIKN